MTVDREGCCEAEADALVRVMAARDLLDCVLWREVDPLRGVEHARTALVNAGILLRDAGYERP